MRWLNEYLSFRVFFLGFALSIAAFFFLVLVRIDRDLTAHKSRPQKTETAPLRAAVTCDVVKQSDFEKVQSGEAQKFPSDPDPQVRKQALYVLFRARDADPIERAAKDETDASVRLFAVECARKLKEGADSTDSSAQTKDQ